MSTVKRLRVSLGTLVAIAATADSTVRAEAAVEAAFAAIAQVDRRMHPRSAESDLARINCSALHVPIEVHPSVGELLNLARRINTLTDKVFDPCLPTQTGRLSDIAVSANGTEIICHAAVALDFGGFAKGYAVDCAIDVLIEAGCTAGLVNAGGDLRVFGLQAEPMFIRGRGGELVNVELSDAALAVSDVNSRQRPAEHQGYYVRGPVAAPKTPQAGAASDIGDALANVAAHGVGNGTSGIRRVHGVGPAPTYAAVIASTAVVADALAKCVLLCPPAVAAGALRAFGATQLQPSSTPASADNGAPPPAARAPLIDEP